MQQDVLKELNPEQRKAAETSDGPVLILAGAGSGKTKTLTHRIAYMIQNGVKPFNILAVTFTNKAAQEMKSRISKLVGASAMPIVGTFHALCLRILRVEGERLGYSRNFVIYDTQDQRALLKKVCIKLHIDTKQTNPSLFGYLISGAKNQLLTVTEYQGRATEYAEEMAGKVYAEYQKQLKDANAVDFDDLIMLTVQLFEQHPDVLKKYREQFRYIMVDEYQDTNAAQYKLVRLLAKKYKNICVVGDDWQAIYSFRGADLQNILDFEKDYPEAKVFFLEQNYRSTQKILDAAQSVIAQNKKQKKKKLWTDLAGGEPVRLFETSDEREEATFIARSIRDRVYDKKQSFRDFALLYRTNAQSRALEEACLEYNIPYRIVGGMRFYDRKEVKDILSYLTFLKNPKDILSFERIINVPPRGIGKSSMDRAVEFSVHGEVDLYDACRQAEKIPGLQAARANALKNFAATIDRLRDASARLTLDFLVDAIVADTGYKEFLLDGTEEGESRFENIQELKTVAKRYKDIETFLENVALVSDTDSYDEDANVVTLMTLHAAKGLEFKHVYLVGLEEGILPHSQSMMSQEEIDEERRLLYVGMTRARATLHLVFATFRTLYGKPMVNGISRFLQEIPDGLIKKNFTEHARLYTNSAEPKVEEGDGDFVDEVLENPFQIGDSVYHATFGRGKVVSRDDDTVEVAFEAGGSRELSVAHAPLKKLDL